MAVGAGVAWRLFERVELFGEYRFLHVNPDPAESAGVFRRDLDAPTLKGGINIRLP
jgi:opacity protein-like surface antigen